MIAGNDKTKASADEMVSQCIVTRLRLANRVITRLYDDALRPFGLTVSQMALLAVGAHFGAIRQGDVTRLLQLDDSTLSRNLDRMRANGWVELTDDPDARVHTHLLTAAGKALFDRAVPGWRAAQKRATELLGKAGVDALYRFADANGFKT
jgi:DNA-binding MarR family transcriptional regulator